MSLSRWTLAIGAILTLVAAAPATAARGAGAPGYDPGSEVTLTGVVVDVWERDVEPGFTGLHLRLQSERETVEVRVGPLFFVAEAGLWLEVGDRICLTGFRTRRGVSAITARSIELGGEVLELRDAEGFPLWSRQGRRFRSPAPRMTQDAVLVIPAGDPVAGKLAFAALKCGACHAVAGNRSAAVAAAGRLAPDLDRGVGLWSAEGIASAILSPSHFVDPLYASREGSLSRMGDFSDAITLRQWVDLVSYLQSLDGGQDRVAHAVH